MNDPTWLSACELLDLYARRDLSPVEVVSALARPIEALNGELRAFVALRLDEALDEARRAESVWRTGGDPRRPLLGVPFAVKDLFATSDLPTECGSPLLAGRRTERDAAAVHRLRLAGAVLVGKTATHEFAWGLTMVNERLGSTHNPWDPARTPGGSSGGSAVALATGMVPLALGTDTGGSIRLPSAFCGTAGLKPTHGRVSLDGCWPLAPSLDHAGPMARTPEDLVLALAALDGALPDDRGPVASGPSALSGLTLGRLNEPVPVAARVRDAVDDAAAALAGRGAVVEEVVFPASDRLLGAFGALFLAEALRTHVDAGLWPARRDEYGPNVAERLILAERSTLVDHVAAAIERERLRDEVRTLFERVGLVIGPVCATPAPGLDQARFTHAGHEVELRDVVGPYVYPQDLLGLPACVVRAGFDAHGLPVGVQLTGRPGDDATVLGAATALVEVLRDVQSRRPSLSA